MARSLTKGDAGYTLALTPDHVDALTVRRLAQEAAAARGTGDPERVIELCDRALGLFHGEVLPAVADAPWAQPYRQRLTETRLDLTEDRLAARVDLGAGSELVSELEELVAAHPLREHGWILLVTTLVRAGRQGDALAACARVRGLLARELGIDPGPQLRLLEEQVLRQDPALLGPARPAAPVPPAAAGPPTGNLPTASGSLHRPRGRPRAG